MKPSSLRFWFDFFCGWFLIVAGVALLLHFWKEIMMLVKALIGPVLVMAGLLLLYFTQNRKAV